MKRTTYIFIGAYLLGLIIIIFPIIYITSFLEEQYPYQINLSHDNEIVNMDMDKIKVIKTGINKPEGIEFINTSGNLVILPSGEDRDRITYARANYLQIFQVADTLHISFDFSHPSYKEAVENHKGLFLEDLNIVLKLSPELSLIDNNTNLSVNVRNINVEFLRIESSQTINLDSCSMNTLSITGNHFNLIKKNSHIANFYLDLDNVRKMETENCIIDNQYFAGSRNHETPINKSNYKRIIWEPKDENAKLKLELDEPSEVFIN